MPDAAARILDALWNRVIETELGTILVAELGRRGVAATIYRREGHVDARVRSL